MDNKMEVHLIVNACGDASIELSAHNMKGSEAKTALLALINSIAGSFSENSLEKAAFLKAVQDSMEKLILETLSDYQLF